MQGLNLQVVRNVEDADFVLAHGTEALGLPSGDPLPMNLDELERILEHCAKRKLPMIVANPDYVTVEARALRVMPGKVGEIADIVSESQCVECTSFVVKK